jgi:hypothetical protein
MMLAPGVTLSADHQMRVLVAGMVTLQEKDGLDLAGP